MIFFLVSITGLICYLVYRNATLQDITFKNRPIEPTGSRDAFGRERVSEPFTLGDYKLIYGDNSDFLQKITGSGATLVNRTDKAAVRLSVTESDTGSIIHQTRKYHHYMPGKSQLIFASFVLYEKASGVTKKIGYFDDEGGIYLQQNPEGILSLNIKDPEGKVNSISKNNWDTDIDIDVSKTQLMFIDFQWLGVGRIRFGFVSKDEYIICHTVYNSNLRDEVFMSSPNLPIRFEISSVSQNTGGYIDQICSTVISEGGYSESGREWSYGTQTAKSVASGATEAILSIRLTNTYNGYKNRMTVEMKDIDILSEDDNIYYELRKIDQSSDISSNWTDIETDESGVSYSDTTNVSVVSGSVISTGYVTGGNRKGATGGLGSDEPTNTKQNYITQNYDSTDSQAYLLVCKNIGSSSTNVYGSLSWKEIY
jgi:hypothetical protein